MASARTDRSGDLLPRGGSAHPLLGADLRTVIALLRRHGVRPSDRLGVIAGALASSAARAPISLCERAVASRAIARLDPEPPIFILGHWRSGTTHLYNILSRSDDFAFVSPIATGLPWDVLLLGRALRPVLERALPRERFIDPLPVNPDSPQEDEAALANMQTVSFYHGLYFPRRLRQEVERGVFFDELEQRDIRLWEQRFRHFLGKVSLLSPKRRPVIKNPVYTARLGMIQRMFPRAQYIHIHRNPYSVFFSMRRFYTKLLEAYALQPYSLNEIDELVLSVYERMMDRMIEDVRRLPDGALVEISYDELASSARVLPPYHRRATGHGRRDRTLDGPVHRVHRVRPGLHTREPAAIHRRSRSR